MGDDRFYGLEHEIDGVRIGDKVVLGRKVRDYGPTEFPSIAACNAFTSALYEQVQVGNDLCHIIGQDFHDAFYAHRSVFAREEVARRKEERAHELLRRLLGEEAAYELLSTFVVGHVGWEGDHEYVVFRQDGVVRYLGTDHGAPRLHERADIEGLLKGAEELVVGIRVALDIR